MILVSHTKCGTDILEESILSDVKPKRHEKAAILHRDALCHKPQEIETKLECGPMPNVMATLPNIGGALCSTPQSFADAHYYSAVQ